jgi:hypothetical protein
MRAAELRIPNVKQKILVVLFVVKKTTSSIGWCGLCDLNIICLNIIQEQFVQAGNV